MIKIRFKPLEQIIFFVGATQWNFLVIVFQTRGIKEKRDE